MIKDLRVIANRNLENVVIVDNCVGGFANQLENGIPISDFLGEKDDNELLLLKEYLIQLNEMEGSISANNNEILDLKKLRYYKDSYEYVKTVRKRFFEKLN